jgi:hypothetical protein
MARLAPKNSELPPWHYMRATCAGPALDITRATAVLMSGIRNTLGRIRTMRPVIRIGLAQGRPPITKMPFQPSISQMRLDNIILWLNTAVPTVETISNGLNTPFLGPIVSTMWSLLYVIQVVLGH